VLCCVVLCCVVLCCCVGGVAYIFNICCSDKGLIMHKERDTVITYSYIYKNKKIY